MDAIGALIPFLFLGALLWLLVLRPQRRRVAAQQKLLSELRPGQEIVTAGGLIGTVSRVEQDLVVLEVAPGTELRIDKRAVAARTDETPG